MVASRRGEAEVGTMGSGLADLLALVSRLIDDRLKPAREPFLRNFLRSMVQWFGDLRLNIRKKTLTRWVRVAIIIRSKI
jgi:hypothetical protein